MAVRIHLRLASLIRGAVNMWLVHLAASIRATACLDLHFQEQGKMDINLPNSALPANDVSGRQVTCPAGFRWRLAGFAS